MPKIAALAILLLILPSLPAAGQVTHDVQQSSLSFLPSDLTIQVGDTVRWIWSSSSHTVTSGTGSADPQVGSLFDAPLNSSFPVFEFVFTEVGEVLYFCRPHEGFDMKGIIRVEESATPAPVPGPSLLRVRGLVPNPFNPRVTLQFTLDHEAPVELSVHDARGRLVRRLSDGLPLEAGEHELIWDGRDGRGLFAASGVYHFRIRVPGQVQSVRGVLAR